MKIDFKYSHWERIEIPRELEEKFKEWLKHDHLYPFPFEVQEFLRNQNFEDIESQDVEDNRSCLYPEENRNCPTAELLDDDDNTIWNNVDQFNRIQYKAPEPRPVLHEDYGQTGGIYVAKDEEDYEYDGKYNVSFGKGLHMLSEGITHIDQDVEIGGFHNYKHLNGYALSVNNREMKWKIKDTGFKCCKHILAEGSCTQSFIDSLRPYLKAFMK